MSTPKVRVLISDSLNPVAQKMLDEAGGFSVDDRAGISPSELVEIIGEYDVLIVRSRTKVTREVLEAADNLKVIGRAGIGVDNIDVQAATQKGVIVMNAPSGNSTSAAELAIAHMFGLARHLVNAGQTIRSGGWDKKKFMGREIRNSTLGLIGLGNIGAIVADRARALQMNVQSFDPFVSPERMDQMGIRHCGNLDELLQTSDFISIHTPLTPKTRHMIGKEELQKMKPTGFLINCARGGIVMEDALAEGLEKGWLAGAAMDVFETEPPGACALAEQTKFHGTPHLGASTHEAQTLVAKELVEQIIDYFVRNVVRNAVNLPRVQAEEQAALWPYVTLARKLGKFAGHYHEGGVSEIRVNYHGEIFEPAVVAMVTNAALKGVLESGLGTTVNLVNAPVLAKERGIDVNETFDSATAAFTRLLSIRLSGPKHTNEVHGTLFGEEDTRIVRIDDYRIEVIPDGKLLVSRNTDVPGIIGKVGTLLGNSGINVNGLQVSLPETGQKEALAVWNIDSAVGEETLQCISDIDHIHACKQISL